MVQGYHKGTVTVTTATTFDSFLRQVSCRIPGLDPQHFHIQIVCSRAGAPPDARQYIPIHESTVSLPFPMHRSILEQEFLDTALFLPHLQCMHLSVPTVTLSEVTSCSGCISSGFAAPALLQNMLAHCLQNWVMAAAAQHLADLLGCTICAFSLLSDASIHCLTSFFEALSRLAYCTWHTPMVGGVNLHSCRG